MPDATTLPFAQKIGHFVGIDPGVKGGIVALWNDSIYTFSSVGKNVYDIRNWTEWLVSKQTFGVNIHILLEEVSGFIGGEVDGKKRNVASAHTTFTLGEHFGMIQMALVCSRLSFRMIRPQEWRKRLGLEGKTKNELKKRAKELFPEEKINLNTADAFLLAYLCRSLNK